MRHLFNESEMALFSDARRRVLEDCLTPPTLSETPFCNN
jgi:hypothetical protein